MIIRKILACILLLLATSIHAQTLTNGGKIKPEQAIMDIRHYTIALNVDFNQKFIDGYIIIDVVMAQPAKVLLFDLMDSLLVSKVFVNDKSEPFLHQNNLITINLTDQLPAR